MDRYEVMAVGKQDEWLPNCPVKIEKYNILFDFVENTNILQVKYKNVSDKKIKSVWIAVNGYDDAMDATVSRSDIAYMNVNADVYSSFGSDKPVSLKSSTTSRVTIIIEKAVFDDNTVWRNENNEVGVVLPQVPACEKYGELFEQYRIEAQKLKIPTINAFVDENDFWICPCGQGNLKNNAVCCDCGTSFEKLKQISDIVYLKKAQEERLEKEAELEKRRAEMAAEEERKRIEKEEADRKAAIEAAEHAKEAEKRKKIFIKKCILTFVSLIVICVVGYNAKNFINYLSAENSVKKAEYDTAIQKYEKLNGFLSSEEKLLDAKYLQAGKLAEQNTIQSLNESIEIYTELEDYNDSKEQKEMVNYNLANLYISEDSIDSLKNAAHIYKELGAYEDSEQKLIETYYNIAVKEYNSGDYASAKSHYALCGNYNNSQEMALSSGRQSTLMRAADNYNKGRYSDALYSATRIPGVTSAKQGVASANQIAEWSKEKLYEQTISGKLIRANVISNLELLSGYNYKDCSSRLYNIKYKYTQISGTYASDKYSSFRYLVTADYKTNMVTVKYKDSDYSDYYEGELLSTGGIFGSVYVNDYYWSDGKIKFYDGYLITAGGGRFNKIS